MNWLFHPFLFMGVVLCPSVPSSVALWRAPGWCFYFPRRVGSGEHLKMLVYTVSFRAVLSVLGQSRSKNKNTNFPPCWELISFLLRFILRRGEALPVPSHHIALPFIFFVITAGNFARLEETFTSIKPPNLHQASDRLGPNGSRFTSFQAPSIRLTVTADGPVILSIFHTQTSGLLTALCTLGNCFCCELNFN